MELSDLYSQRILEIAANQPIPGRLVHPDATVRRVSRVCGSSIEIDLAVRDGRISAYGHTVAACALGQTSTAIVAARVVGTPVGEFRELREQMAAMLRDASPPPEGRWSDLACLAPVHAYPARHGSTMLVFDAIVAALDEIEARRPSEASA